MKELSIAALRNVIKAAIPQRFHDIPPNEFESFIARFFADNGYDVEQTPISGDFGADIIIRKEGVATAVQVKRYASKNKVGVQDVNQVIGAKDYYGCDASIVVTTSSFTGQAKKLMDTAGCEAWDWSELYQRLCQTYFEGKDHVEYFAKDGTKPSTAGLSFEIKKISYEVEMKTIGECTLIFMDVKNTGTKNIETSLTYPTFISPNKRQYEAVYWYAGYFSQGMIYPGCTVEAAFMFKTEQVPKVTQDSKFICGWYNEKTGNKKEIVVSYTGFRKTPRHNSTESKAGVITFIIVGLIILLLLIGSN